MSEAIDRQPATLEIRVVKPDEYQTAGRVTGLAYRDYAEGRTGWWDDYLDRIEDVAGRADRTTVLVAVDEGTILGTATLEFDDRIEPDRDPLPPGDAEIRMLGVDPAVQGRGIGRALMLACEELARASGIRRSVLHTNEDMTAARHLYEDLGYVREEDVVTPSGHVILRYVKLL
jgi:ribosomal protein S18 acetylase RimI-like enzyme